jgi:hypothetical protein
VYQVREIFELEIQPQMPFGRNIVMLNGASFFHVVKKGKLTVFKVSLYNINKAIQAKDLKKRPLEEIVLEQYHELRQLICKMLADRLPPH